MKFRTSGVTASVEDQDKAKIELAHKAEAAEVVAELKKANDFAAEPCFEREVEAVNPCEDVYEMNGDEATKCGPGRFFAKCSGKCVKECERRPPAPAAQAASASPVVAQTTTPATPKTKKRAPLKNKDDNSTHLNDHHEGNNTNQNEHHEDAHVHHDEEHHENSHAHHDEEHHHLEVEEQIQEMAQYPEHQQKEEKNFETKSEAEKPAPAEEFNLNPNKPVTSPPAEVPYGPTSGTVLPDEMKAIGQPAPEEKAPSAITNLPRKTPSKNQKNQEVVRKEAELFYTQPVIKQKGPELEKPNIVGTATGPYAQFTNARIVGKLEPVKSRYYDN